MPLVPEHSSLLSSTPITAATLMNNIRQQSFSGGSGHGGSGSGGSGITYFSQEVAKPSTMSSWIGDKAVNAVSSGIGSFTLRPFGNGGVVNSHLQPHHRSESVPSWPSSLIVAENRAHVTMPPTPSSIQNHLVSSSSPALFSFGHHHHQHVKPPAGSFFSGGGGGAVGGGVIGSQPYHPLLASTGPLHLVAQPPATDYRASMFAPSVALHHYEHNSRLRVQQQHQQQLMQHQSGAGRDLIWGAAVAHRPPFPFPLPIVHPAEQRLATTGWIGGSGSGGFSVPFRQTFP